MKSVVNRPYLLEVLCILVLVHASRCEDICVRRPLGIKTDPLPPDNRFQIKIYDVNSNNIINDKYIPNKNYTVRLFSTDGLSTFIAFTISAEADKKRNDKNPRKPLLLNPGIIRNDTDPNAIMNPSCNNTVMQADITEKTDVKVRWHAPPKGNKCVTIYAVLAVRQDVWYNFEGPMSKLVCEDRRNMDDMQPLENDDCQACEDAKYLLTFEGIWSYNTHPQMFLKTELSGLPRFSDVVGASHNKYFSVYKVNSDATEGLKMLAEQGNTTRLEMEILTKLSSSVRTLIKASGQPKPNMETHAMFRVTREHHLVSLVTAIIPSPDWFLGVANMELCDVLTNKWAPNLTLNIYPLDAGTDSGTTFDAANENTMPPQPISGAVINKSIPKEQIRPFARLHFELMRTYSTPACDTTESVHPRSGDVDRTIDDTPPTTTSTPEVISPDPGSTEECPMTTWEEWQPCTGSKCENNVYSGIRTRVRYHLVDDLPVGKDFNDPDISEKEIPENCRDEEHIQIELCEEECEEEEEEGKVVIYHGNN